MKILHISLILCSLALLLLPAGLALALDPGSDGFAEYDKPAVTVPETYRGYTLPIDAADLSNTGSFDLTPAQMEHLKANGFVVKPADWKEFYPLYDQTFYMEEPSFVTTDAALHVYHLLFDKILRDLERERFAPDITALSTALRIDAEKLYNELSGTSMEETAKLVLAYFSVAEKLLDPQTPIPEPVRDIVTKELALIDAHTGLSEGVLFPGQVEDYSQYVPRGHYTKSEDLSRYFRAMMWYGRRCFRLDNSDETKAALLITYLMDTTGVGADPAASVWERVYEPTGFLVGKSDDLSISDYRPIMKEVFGASFSPKDLGDKKKLSAFMEKAETLPPPQINSMWVYIWEDEDEVTKGFRFMGQRFVLDAYIFEQLIFRNVGTLENPRMLPVGLDVMAALGSDEALSILEKTGETAYLNYPEQMEKVKAEIAGLKEDSWTQTIYWAWLYTFLPLLEEKGASYPAFMRNDSWERKDLATAMGSWTELKHDTILYAKQVMAEMGGEEPPVITGWVEPQPEVYARLLALTRMTRTGLDSRALLTENVSDILDRLDSLLVFLLDVSQKELKGIFLERDEYDRIMYIGGTLEWLTLSAADGEGYAGFFEKIDSALVADVATDAGGSVLEEATGRVFEIYVAVPNGNGGLSIARGGVFSYYEFPWPIGDRLTDESWRLMLDEGRQPDRPAWTDTFIK
ncbi:MAG: DUF3160 domain-containing protein [Deltaproteobacteria bacterium]|nr:DUF3160 domain-containing protein [Candidatus Zymogenaceae bacterium]